MTLTPRSSDRRIDASDQRRHRERDREHGKAPAHPRELSPAELGGLAHLYRGEVYRSPIWRTRLDTHWSVVTLGVALSLTFSAPTG
jgi:uncharacterized membrane protein